MTIRELYEQIGGSYEHAVQIMKKDKMIHKYLLKLADSGVYEKFSAAGESMDPTQLFESAHAMKGVCANLGLDELAHTVGTITEEFRPGAVRKLTDAQVKAGLDKAGELYRRAEDGIRDCRDKIEL